MGITASIRSSKMACLLGVVVVTVGVAACGGDTGNAAMGPATERPSTITINGFAFMPATVSVATGTRVEWRNQDQVLHTATAGSPGAPSGAFDGQMEGAGSSFGFKFDEAGIYPFFCSRHEFMRGEIKVTPQ